MEGITRQGRVLRLPHVDIAAFSPLLLYQSVSQTVSIIVRSNNIIILIRTRVVGGRQWYAVCGGSPDGLVGGVVGW